MILPVAVITLMEENVDTVTESYSGRIGWNTVPMSLADYRQAFEIVKRNILAGNSYLANLTCKVPVSTNLTLEDVFDSKRFFIDFVER